MLPWFVPKNRPSLFTADNSCCKTKTWCPARDLGTGIFDGYLSGSSGWLVVGLELSFTKTTAMNQRAWSFCGASPSKRSQQWQVWIIALSRHGMICLRPWQTHQEEWIRRWFPGLILMLLAYPCQGWVDLRVWQLRYLSVSWLVNWPGQSLVNPKMYFFHFLIENWSKGLEIQANQLNHPPKKMLEGLAPKTDFPATKDGQVIWVGLFVYDFLIC